MRAYFFGNFYLSSIQQGIQAQHCTAEMFIKYDGCTDRRELQLREWAGSHKTTILLNGGEHEDLLELTNIMGAANNPYPWAFFVEPGVNSCLGSVGIILPPKVYADGASLIRTMRRGGSAMPTYAPTKWETEFLHKMVQCGMAR